MKRDPSAASSGIVMIEDAIKAEAPMFIANYPSRLADTYQAMIEIVQAIAADEDNGPVNPAAPWVKVVQRYMTETVQLTATFKAVNQRECADKATISNMFADITRLLNPQKCPGHPQKSVEVWSHADRRFLCTKCMMKKADRSDCTLLEDFAKDRLETLKKLHETCTELMSTRGSVLMQMLTIEKEDLDRYVAEVRRKRVAGDAKAGTSNEDGNVTLETAETLAMEYGTTMQLLHDAIRLLETLSDVCVALENKLSGAVTDEVEEEEEQGHAAHHPEAVEPSELAIPCSTGGGLLPVPVAQPSVVSTLPPAETQPAENLGPIAPPVQLSEHDRALSDMLAQLLQDDYASQTESQISPSWDPIVGRQPRDAMAWDGPPPIAAPASVPPQVSAVPPHHSEQVVVAPAAAAAVSTLPAASVPEHALPVTVTSAPGSTVVKANPQVQRPWADMFRSVVNSNPIPNQQANPAANGKMAIPKPRSHQ